jgi:hypothetical protein
MQRRTYTILAAVILVASIAFLMLRKKHHKSRAFAVTGTPFPSSLGTLAPRGSLWSKFGKSTRAPGTTRAPWTTRSPKMMRGAVATASPAARVAVPTIKPDLIPPFTLGPVPNGITRVPEPPTMQPVADSDLVLDQDGGFTLFDAPASAGATIIGGMNVPAVQNPWNVASWQFLRGADVSSALGVVKNLFPSFPITTRSVKEGPKMSGAVTLVYDEGNKVSQIVRD